MEKQRKFMPWEAFGFRAEGGLCSRVVQSVCGEGKEELQVSVEKEGAASTQALSHSQVPPPMGCSFLATCETQGMDLSSNPCDASPAFPSAQQAVSKCRNCFGAEFVLSMQHLPISPGILLKDPIPWENVWECGEHRWENERPLSSAGGGLVEGLETPTGEEWPGADLSQVAQTLLEFSGNERKV